MADDEKSTRMNAVDDEEACEENDISAAAASAAGDDGDDEIISVDSQLLEAVEQIKGGMCRGKPSAASPAPPKVAVGVVASSANTPPKVAVGVVATSTTEPAGTASNASNNQDAAVYKKQVVQGEFRTLERAFMSWRNENPDLEIGSQQVEDDHTPGAHPVDGGGAAQQAEQPDEDENEEKAEEADPPRTFEAALVVDGEDETEPTTQHDDLTHGELRPMSHPSRRIPAEVIEGRVLKRDDQQTEPTTQCGRLPFSIFICITVCGATIAILTAVLVSDGSAPGSGEDNGTTTIHQGVVATPTTHPPFQDGLPSLIVRAINDTSSPYYKSNAWMIHDPLRDNYSAERQLQRFHMASFYYFTQGDNWTRNDGWLDYTVPECDWFSKSPVESVCDESGFVITLNLTANNLQGDITGITDWKVTSMKIFDVSHNSLSGSPPNIYNNPAIEYTDVSHNNFSTPIAGGGDFFASGLRVLRSNNNRLFGDNPLAFLLFPNLEVLNNSHNLYANPLAKEMTNCRNLTHYSSRYNDKYGTIPTQYGRLTNLQEFDIRGNPRMDGTIPTQLGLLTALTSLDIWGTSITGSIPEGLCRRYHSGDLAIHANCSLIDCCD